jgi:septum formation protein
MSHHALILASGSPRRRELLGAMGVAFEVVTAEVCELDADSAPHLAPAALARENARLKAMAVAALRPSRWILGADTVVAMDGKLFGKPASLGEAAKFLRMLSGRRHEVITGCALVGPEGGVELMHDVSRVTFLPLSDETIARYLAAVNVLDKAGAYAVQQHGEWIIERVEGSRHNVVGLPTEALESFLLRYRAAQT